MAAFNKLEVKRFSSSSTRLTAEKRFWKKFKTLEPVQHVSRVSHIDFCPKKPHNFAATSSTRVSIYDGQSCDVVKTISRFRNTAYSGNFRKDGKLVVAGCENADAQVFDVNSRVILRTFHGHRSAVHVTRFASEGHTVLTGSDDCTAQLWDLSSGEVVARFGEHSDYVRAGLESPTGEDMWVTGSYDQTVKLWDRRTATSSNSVSHGAAVEALAFLPGGLLLVSAGDNFIRIWDVRKWTPVYSVSNHQKTITALAVDGTASRLLTGSLDHHVKFHELTSFKVTHCIKYPDAVMSLGISASHNVLAVGLLSGQLSIRKRVEEPKTQPARRPPRTGTRRFFARGQNQKALPGDVVAVAPRKPRLAPFEILLKNFRYKEALDVALKTGHASTVTALLEDVAQQGALQICLGGRTERRLLPVLRFLNKHLQNPHYSALLIDVASMLLDLYARHIGENTGFDELILQLQQQVWQEVTLQKQLLQVQGSLDAVMTANGRVAAQLVE